MPLDTQRRPRAKLDLIASRMIIGVFVTLVLVMLIIHAYSVEKVKESVEGSPEPTPIVASLSNSHSGSGYTTMSIGDTGKLSVGEGVVDLAKDEDTEGQLTDAAVQSDKAAYQKILFSGKCFEVKDGTKVKLLKETMTMRMVRILEGKHQGEEGWIPTEWVSK